MIVRRNEIAIAKCDFFLIDCESKVFGHPCQHLRICEGKLPYKCLITGIKTGTRESLFVHCKFKIVWEDKEGEK